MISFIVTLVWLGNWIHKKILMMADEERYTVYSPTARRVYVSVVNKNFNMKDYSDLQFAVYNRNLLPFKDYLGFDVLKTDDGKDAHMNVSYSGLERLINKVENKLNGHNECCLAVSISSHGKIEEKDGKINHFLLCSESKSRDQETKKRWFCTNELVKRFREGFEGPMIVFIQACRGEETEYGTEVHRTEQEEQQNSGLDSGFESMSMTSTGESRNTSESDSVNSQGPGAESSLPVSGDNSASSTSTTKDDDQLVDQFAPMCPHDCVVAFASAHNHISKSCNKSGGWLLKSFDSTVEKLGKNEERSILSLLTEANNPESGMAGEKSKEGEKCIGSFQHKLVKELILKHVAEKRGGAGDEVEKKKKHVAEKESDTDEEVENF